MGILSFLFGGKYPTTKKYEAQQQQHLADFDKFNEFAKSSTLARYNELKELTNSSDFKKQVTKLKEEKFSSTEAYAKQQQYLKLKSSSDIVGYLKFTKKGLDTKLENALESTEYNRYVELQALVNTPEFRKAMTQKNSEEFRQNKEYQKLAGNSNVKFVKKTLASPEYRNYTKVKDSENLKKYYELESYVNSSEFIDLKREIEDPKRFKKSEEYQLLNEFNLLSKNKTLVWYQQMLSTDAFADIKKWNLTFEENFDGSHLDENKWVFGYFWGVVNGVGCYSTENERQAFSKNNIRILNSELTLETHKESAKGKVWNPVLGFVDKDFDYTSAVVNTGNCFRQQYGRFDFKVKLSFDKPITHNIWMVGEKSVPQINVLSYGSGKKEITVGLVTKDATKKIKIEGANFNDNYYIISMMWTPEKIVWYVNGVMAHTYKGSIPQEMMYIVLSSNITSAGETNGSQMSIDWIKCYTWAK